MPEPDVIQQQRAILREFRKATARRAQVEADAEARSKADRTAADSALSQARGAADGHLGPARQAQEAARDLLSKAGLLSLLEQARPSDTASPPGADPARELARCAAVAAETSHDIGAGIKALEAHREATARRRRVLRYLAVGAAVALAVAIFLGYRAAQQARRTAEQNRLAAEQNRLAVEAIKAGPVSVPAGEFLMGSTDADGMANADEKPQHKVYLEAFQIDRTEVTNAMYAKCAQAGKCQAPSSSRSNTRDSYYGNPKFDNYPVTNVSWTDAQAYCAWADARLPTEAEWEKAARGADGRIYPWGNDPADAQRCNFNSNVKDATPVGAYPAGASPYGALDMAGNVWEWVADWYQEAYYASSPARNPAGPSSGDTRVLRGGSWDNGGGGVRAAYRFGVNPDFGLGSSGFRCARSP